MESCICDDEATKWRRCTEQNLGDLNLEKKCTVELAAFDQCIVSWRLNGAKDVKIKGTNEGEPPPQCAGLSCLIGRCLQQTNYDFSRCKVHMQHFKHCVRSFYGSEYIV
ncbi:hypothetical protein TraAM80_04482 [Trypanosoma rangeli]|uniref:Uncharacterized protein n=1 Tax=Trypanosoma rangeli TaxID=5698 RepID=A0A422NJZ3_TRYRA|nr:uncharacterized protein TraAM80_04482 [Trypanosoma rangeli]RNF05649.1 hypothetical protein TraAM80_04482 [Trypanosoma rangeli]|eukprot:RNF05649.1 hypothetical protein TraAM80_04482 [Trypanosoma rangeli]